jgi:hypothetical protein
MILIVIVMMVVVQIECLADVVLSCLVPFHFVEL